MKHSSKIQAVVFDIDDTLYLERDFVHSGYLAVAEYLRQSTGRADVFEDWLWGRFQAGKVARAFNDLNDEFQLSLEPSDISRLVEVYRFHEPEISPFAGIPELLDDLGRRFALGIVSDGPARMQRNKLIALGLTERFQAVVLTDDLGPDSGKPSPAGFQAIVEKLSVPHPACVYVSDNPAKDFIAPNQLGWLTIRYIREGQVYADRQAPPGGEPAHLVHNDSKLLELLG